MRWVCNTITSGKCVFEGVLLLAWKEVGRLKTGTAIGGLLAVLQVGGHQGLTGGGGGGLGDGNIT